MLSSHLSPWHKIIHLILITSWCYYYRPHLGVRMYLTFPMKNETQRGSIILRSESGRSRFWTHAVWLQSLCVSPLCSTDYGKPSPWDGNWLAQSHTARRQWRWELNPDSVALKLVLLTSAQGPQPPCRLDVVTQTVPGADTETSCAWVFSTFQDRVMPGFKVSLIQLKDLEYSHYIITQWGT